MPNCAHADFPQCGHPLLSYTAWFYDTSTTAPIISDSYKVQKKKIVGRLAGTPRVLAPGAGELVQTMDLTTRDITAQALLGLILLGRAAPRQQGGSVKVWKG